VGSAKCLQSRAHAICKLTVGGYYSSTSCVYPVDVRVTNRCTMTLTSSCLASTQAASRPWRHHSGSQRNLKSCACGNRRDVVVTLTSMALISQVRGTWGRFHTSCIQQGLRSRARPYVQRPSPLFPPMTKYRHSSIPDRLIMLPNLVISWSLTRSCSFCGSSRILVMLRCYVRCSQSVWPSLLDCPLASRRARRSG
jgi:hypothetical protein